LKQQSLACCGGALLFLDLESFWAAFSLKLRDHTDNNLPRVLAGVERSEKFSD
jgi:hypothetical protein